MYQNDIMRPRQGPQGLAPIRPGGARPGGTGSPAPGRVDIDRVYEVVNTAEVEISRSAEASEMLVYSSLDLGREL
jgi:hypothetical protein